MASSSISIIEQFNNYIRERHFPCVGAKSADAYKQIEFHLAQSIKNHHSDSIITEKLQLFAKKCTAESVFVSFVVIFQDDSLMTEIEFEHYLWQRLQGIHDRDCRLYAWDSTASDDPNFPNFSMSIGGKAFYIVGIHPGAHRLGRQFSYPSIVFNLYSQFHFLQNKGSFNNIRNKILQRDAKLNGSENKMLLNQENVSEARQYSGRNIEGDWKCPFISRNSNKTPQNTHF
jgi:FPC/CPF motif-containing protein YcgG